MLVGDEPELPYERPPLSKDYLRGEAPREQARVHPEGFYAEHDIELLTGTAVTAIDTAARAVDARRAARRLAYDRLLLATGLRAAAAVGAGRRARRRPPPARRSPTATRIAAALAARRPRGDRRRRLDRHGGGGVGAAEGARGHGRRARRDAARARARPRGRRALRAAAPRARRRRCTPASRSRAWRGRDASSASCSPTARALDADLLVAGLGAIPRTALAERAGLAVENGVVCDERACRPAIRTCSPPATSPTPSTRSTGAGCASSTGPTRCTSRRWRRRRCSASPPRYDRLPYFFSDQYDVGMEYRGLRGRRRRARDPRRRRALRVRRLLAARGPHDRGA